MKKSFLNNFQIRVMLLFLLIGLVPLCIVGAFAINTADELITNSVSSHLENVADDKAALLERWITERKSDLEVLAGSSIIKSMDPALIGPYLQLVEAKYKVYRGFVILSNSGETVFSSVRGKLPDMTGLHSVEEPAVSDVIFDPERKESVFHISAPITGDGGYPFGSICATVGTEAITSAILKVSLGRTGECYLVDEAGTFLAHREPKRILTDNIAHSESFKNIFGASRQKKIYTDYRGIEVLGASRKVGDLDWYLVVEQDRDEAFTVADRLERYVYTAIIISAIGAIFLAWLFSFHIVSPIRNLSDAARKIAAGNLENVVPETSRSDEIGLLHNTFRQMSTQLAARQHTLEEKMELTQTELRETDVKLQKTLLAAARSQQLAALGRLAAGVTHEIRTPIASLKLFLQSVKADIEISPEYEEDFRIAMNQVKRIEATVNRFLDFAKPQEPVFSILEPATLVEESLLVVRPKANQQETAISIAVDKTLPEIRGDRKQLVEVLVNLMVNALEAMPSRGKLGIAAQSDYCVFNGSLRPCVRINISDTGIGISGENLPKLFDPFFTTKASGTGLGLSIVQSTVSRHGGLVNVTSTAGEGTLFSIYLPAFAQQGNEEHG